MNIARAALSDFHFYNVHALSQAYELMVNKKNNYIVVLGSKNGSFS